MKIYEFLKAMKGRPLMYIREEKMELIFHFLLGFCNASYKYNAETDDNMDCKFVSWFGGWIKRWEKKQKIIDDIPYSTFWYDDIKIIAKNENDECRVFYELVDLFFEDYNKKRGFFRWRRS